MALQNTRLNLSLDKQLYKTVKQLAKKENKSVAEMVRKLTRTAIDQHEDLLLSIEIKKRENLSKKTVSHNEAWK